MHFHKHYTRNEARELLPQVREWLAKLVNLRAELQRLDAEMLKFLQAGADLGGTMVNRWVRCMAEMKEVWTEFLDREIQVKDLDRGLIDFPAILDGREVFLCWEQKEEDIDFWHALEAGYAGRQPLED